MPNTFNLSKDEATDIYARPEERKRISVGTEGASIRQDDEFKKFDPEKAVEIDAPVTVLGPGHFSVEGLDTEPSAPALKANHDDVQNPSRAARRNPGTTKKAAKKAVKASKLPPDQEKPQ